MIDYTKYEYRLYTFCNMYLSSIQNGIQTAHVTHELFNKYISEGHLRWCWTMLEEWSLNHKTIIVCNGGYGSNLREIANVFDDKQNTLFPWAHFHEGADALDGALTCVGIVLPNWIYNPQTSIEVVTTDDAGNNVLDTRYVKPSTSPNSIEYFSEYETKLYKTIKSCGLAR